MRRNTSLVLSAAALVGLTLACTKSSAPLAPTVPSGSSIKPADGSTLKATAPAPQSPVNDQRLTDSTPPTLRASASTALFAAGISFQYRFQVFNDAGALVQDSGLVGSPTWTVTKDLEFNKRHTWQARAELASGDAGPWSTRASFLTAEGGFIRGSSVFDPLNNGKTVGSQHGGHFVAGRGWMADTQSDGIDYDIATCASCTASFDVTNFGKGGGVPIDLKWFTMGDATAFGDFSTFRDHYWKMHLEQRADGDGTGMKIVWRNGGAGPGEPGDHVAKLGSGPRWDDNTVYHFVFDWNPSGFTVSVNGDVWFQDGFGGNAYAPANHRISLGCYPRGETLTGAIWSNVKVTPK